MKSTRSTQKRHTFFLRKYCRLPLRGPPGGPSRRAPGGPDECCLGSSAMVLPSPRLAGLTRCDDLLPGARGLPRAPRRLALAPPDELLLAFQLLVEAHGEVFDHRVGHFQAPLELLDHLALRSAQHQIDVEAFAVLVHAVGQLARAPLLDFLHLAAALGGRLFERGHKLRDFFFRCIGAGDEDQVIQACFHVPSIPCRARCNQDAFALNQSLAGRRHAPVEPVHSAMRAFGQDRLHRFGRLRHHLRGDFQLVPAHRAKHIGGQVAHRVFRLNAQSHARELVSAERANQRLQPIVPAGAAALTDAEHAPGQRDIVVDHDHLGRVTLEPLQQLAHRQAAHVHIRLGLGQQDFLPSQLPPPDVRFRLRPFDANCAALRQPVHDKKTQVVRRPGVFRAGIAEADDQPHQRGRPPARVHRLVCATPPGRDVIRSSTPPTRCYFSFSLGLALVSTSPSASSPSSTSFLPFLMTSGSAGAASATTSASAGFSSSARRATTCAITRCGSLTSFIFWGSSGRSAARSCLPIINSVTSTLNSFGISVGRHSISTSRVTISKIPPCSLTPCGSPNVCTGTLTCMRTSSATRSMSTCSSAPFTGPTCQSFSMALCSPPGSLTVKIVLCPDSDRRMPATCLALTATASGSPVPP